VNGLLLLAIPIVMSVVVIAVGVAIFVMTPAHRPMLLARQKAITALCAQRGLVSEVGSGDFAMVGPIDPHWFANAHATPDHSVAVADFTQPADQHTTLFSILTFTVAGVNIPFVAVARKGLTSVTVGGPPMFELESIDFDNRFTVKAKDRRSATMLLDPGMMQLLLDCEQVSFDMVGNRVLAYVNRAAEPAHQPTEPVEFELLFRFLDGFVTRMPAILRSDYAVES
jgi:hypothetical protein